MFGRMSLVSGDPARLDDLITYVRDVVKPATDKLEGNYGLGMWVNRDNGDALVMTVWADEATLRASEDAVAAMRDEGAGLIGGNAVVERYEALHVDGVEPHRTGYKMRLVQMHCPPADLDDHVGWSQKVVLPRVRQLPGFVSYVVQVDRESGRVATMGTYRDQAGADAAADAGPAIVALATARGITLDAIRTYDVAIVGIRAPIPTQRVVDVTGQKARSR